MYSFHLTDDLSLNKNILLYFKEKLDINSRKYLFYSTMIIIVNLFSYLILSSLNLVISSERGGWAR